MLDLFLAYALAKAIPSDAQVLPVGDIDQLPSVGPGIVLQNRIIRTPSAEACAQISCEAQT
jgi:exodeoxyribonuclease V alpha subunit